LDLSDEFGSKLHHRDVVGVALRRMVREMQSGLRDDIVEDVNAEIRRHPVVKSVDDEDIKGN
jgi:hypothetical protein